MANKLELISLGGISHCYNHNVITLKPPEKASLTCRSLKAQTAEPPMALGGVLNVA